jgi:hypothetical protein
MRMIYTDETFVHLTGPFYDRIGIRYRSEHLFLTRLFARPERRGFTTSQRAITVYKNTMVLRQLWPRSSETLTALQPTV